MGRKVKSDGIISEEDAKFDRLARKYPDGIPAEEYLAAFSSPKYQQIEKEADMLFANLNDGTRNEDDVWAEVWRIMDGKQRHPGIVDKPHSKRLNTDTGIPTRQRGTGFGRQEYEPQYASVEHTQVERRR